MLGKYLIEFLEDSVSLKEECDKTPKTGKQIASEDEVADSATVKTDDKNIKAQQPSKKSKTVFEIFMPEKNPADGGIGIQSVTGCRFTTKTAVCRCCR